MDDESRRLLAKTEPRMEGMGAEDLPWHRSPGPVRRMANSETLICSLAPSNHGEAGAARHSSAEALFRVVEFNPVAMCEGAERVRVMTSINPFVLLGLVRGMQGRILQQVAVDIKRPVEASGSAPSCLDAALHLFMTDRSPRIGVGQSSFDDAHKGQLSQNS